MKMELVLFILLGVSVAGNIFQAIFGIKIENNQTQIVQNVNVNQNLNENLNLVNTELILTNAYINTTIEGNRTNFRMVFPIISTNFKTQIKDISIISNASNWSTISLIRR